MGTEGERLEKEGFNYIRLGTILKRSRTPARMEAVERIVSSSMTVEEKIREIEKLDGDVAPGRERFNPATRDSRKTQAPRGQDDFWKRQDPVKRSVVDSVKNRQRLKRTFPRFGFFDFLLMERGKFVSFANATGMISPGFLGCFPKLDAFSAQRFAERLARDILPRLKPSLSWILAEGWKQLPKYEYNLVAALNRLADEVASLNPVAVAKGKNDAPVKCFGLESAYLPFFARDGLADAAIATVDSALSVDVTRDDERKSAILAARHLLRADAPKPCLHDFVLAVNMLASRRHFAMTDLVVKDQSTLVSPEEYDCSPAVQKAIDAAIASHVSKLASLVTERAGSGVSAKFIPLDDKFELDFSPVAVLLGKEALDPTRKSDVAKLCAEAAAKFTSAFGQRLCADLDTVAMRSARFLPDHALEFELGKLDCARLVLDKSPSGLSQGRYRSIRSGGATPSRVEAELISAISECAAMFRTIGGKVAEVLDRTRAAVQAAREGETAALSPLDEILADQANGRTLGEFAERAARVCLALAGFFMNEEIIAMVQTERMAADGIRTTMRNLERLAHADEYKAIRDHYGLLGY